jgi:hypothetical protein
VPVLDGVVHAGERVVLEGGIYGEVCAFAPDLRAVPNEAWEHFSASDVRALQVHSAGMVQLRRLEVVGLVDRADDEDTRKLAKGMLEVAPNFAERACWWVPVESIEAVVIVPRRAARSPTVAGIAPSRYTSLTSLIFTVQWIHAGLVAHLYLLYEDTRKRYPLLSSPPITVRGATITGLGSIKEGKGYWVALYQRATREIQYSLSL